MHLKKIKKYLPSKEFQRVFFFIVIILIILFVIFYVLPNTKIFSSKKENSLEIYNKTIGEMIETDTDGDSIPDWEERLWGTDINNKFTFGDTSDSVYIQSKKEELKLNKEVNQKELTETDIFAREFFTIFNALKTQEGIDSETINNLSSSLGNNLIKEEIEDKYKKTDIKINEVDNLMTKNLYYEKVGNLYNNYKEIGLGDELQILNNGLTKYTELGEKADYGELLIIAEAYTEFAEKMMELQVPKSLSDYHVDIANNSYKTGKSVFSMSYVISDPVIGISGFTWYQKYSEDLVDSVNKLEQIIEAKLE